ncbi:MAG TPA: hypothetical protein VNA04_09875 [Thermoanaerobaculia bacterium]|nr:hypothetical protein [Thermoanaerobaculia bacterium]
MKLASHAAMSGDLELSQPTDVPRVSVDEMRARLDRGEPILFIDSRSAKSWSASEVKIRGALRIPPDEATRLLDSVPRDRSVVTYCT